MNNNANNNYITSIKFTIYYNRTTNFYNLIKEMNSEN